MAATQYAVKVGGYSQKFKSFEAERLRRIDHDAKQRRDADRTKQLRLESKRRARLEPRCLILCTLPAIIQPTFFPRDNSEIERQKEAKTLEEEERRVRALEERRARQTKHTAAFRETVKKQQRRIAAKKEQERQKELVTLMNSLTAEAYDGGAPAARDLRSSPLPPRPGTTESAGGVAVDLGRVAHHESMLEAALGAVRGAVPEYRRTVISTGGAPAVSAVTRDRGSAGEFGAFGAAIRQSVLDFESLEREVDLPDGGLRTDSIDMDFAGREFAAATIQRPVSATSVGSRDSLDGDSSDGEASSLKEQPVPTPRPLSTRRAWGESAPPPHSSVMIDGEADPKVAESVDWSAALVHLAAPDTAAPDPDSDEDSESDRGYSRVSRTSRASSREVSMPQPVRTRSPSASPEPEPGRWKRTPHSATKPRLAQSQLLDVGMERGPQAARPPNRPLAHAKATRGSTSAPDSPRLTSAARSQRPRAALPDAPSYDITSGRTPTDDEINILWAEMRKGLQGYREGSRPPAAMADMSDVSSGHPEKRPTAVRGGSTPRSSLPRPKGRDLSIVSRERVHSASPTASAGK